MGWCSRRQSSLCLCAIEFCSCNVVAPIAALVFFLAVASAENIYKKSIGKALTEPPGLAMREVVEVFTEKRLAATFFCR